MAARKIKSTLFFRTDQGGFSESFTDMVSPDLSTAKVAALALANLRIGLCGIGVGINGIRVSDQDANPKRSVLVSNNPSGTGFTEIRSTPANTGLGGGASDNDDQLQTSLLLTMKDTDNVRKLMWLSGIPDAIIEDNPPGPNVIIKPSWLPRWVLWRTEIQSGRWGFPRRVRGNALTTPIDIDQWVLQGLPGSRIGAVFTGANPGYVKGKGKVQIRHATLFNNSLLKPNGIWTVDDILAFSGTQTVVYLKGTELIDPTNIDVTGDIQGIDYVGSAIISAEIVRQTVHKRGRPFGLYRGRRTRAR